MEIRKILLFIALVVIVGTIIFLDSTKVDVSQSDVNADINIESLNEVSQNISGGETMGALDSNDKERIAMKAKKYERAKELVNPDGYINTDNITIAEHIGKDVILVDFWTYSCINCQRTLPYITSWYEKYKDEGLLVIGVHTPEFEFEKDYDNVLAATKKWNITYPVVQDNEYLTWQAYQNRYWPRKYLIDIDGFIVYDHIGEGGYAETEKKIQELLQERADVLGVRENISDNVVSYKSDVGIGFGRTPEVYLGYDFSRDQFGNPEGWRPEAIVDYVLPQKQEQDSFYLQGQWKNNPDNMELAGDTGEVVLPYFAKNVNIVAGADHPVVVTIYLDDEKMGKITVEHHDLYQVVSSAFSGRHTLRLEAESGFKLYTFTFG